MVRQCESLVNCVTFLQKEAQKVRKELRKAPRGSLLIQSKNGHPEFLRVAYDKDGERKRMRINRDLPLVYKLAHKAFLEEKLRRLEHNIALCEKPGRKWAPLDDGAILNSLPKHYDLLELDAVAGNSMLGSQVFCPNPCRDGSVPPVDALLDIGGMDVDEWGIKPYCSNTLYEENKIHRTSNGLMCRSKGEVTLIELCNRLGYRYHYDETVYVCGKLKSPDLIIARSDGTLVYVEHRGWNGEEYERANHEKDCLYFYAGIRQGHNYLITFESEDGGLDVELVEMQLRRMVER